MKSVILASFLSLALLAGCGPSNGVHNLSPDEMRRAEINASAFFNLDHPAGTDASGNLVKKKGSFTSCRPQDSNSNNLVTCVGMVPTMTGGFKEITRYCGYNSGKDAIISCSDKDQK